MAWRRPGDKPLSEPVMVSLLTHICVTRPQWVNVWFRSKLVGGWCIEITEFYIVEDISVKIFEFIIWSCNIHNIILQYTVYTIKSHFSSSPSPAPHARNVPWRGSSKGYNSQSEESVLPTKTLIADRRMALIYAYVRVHQCLELMQMSQLFICCSFEGSDKYWIGV